MGVTPKLDPDNAALSLAARVRTIEQCEEYIRATYPRYEGLKSLEKKLVGLGAFDRIVAIVGQE